MHTASLPSEWITRWAHLAPPSARVLDVACGSGRHLRWWAQRGHPVTGVDRDALTLATLGAACPQAELQPADIEAGPWPWPGRLFDVVLVTHYLWRPLLPTLLASLAPGGLLLYETFGSAQARIGRPSRPEFLLQPGELLSVCAGLQIVAFEQGWLDGPPREVQRIAAVRVPPENFTHQPLVGPPAAGG